MRRITLLTDFGTRDGYVGAMKGVLASAAPGVPLDDITHDVAHGDIRGAGYALLRYWDRFPERTVHVAVVDPGVGTRRRPMAVRVKDRFLVLPDNGLGCGVLSQAPGWQAVSLEPKQVGVEVPSTTFHGRDLFAPAAARLAMGTPLADLGPALEDPVRLQEPALHDEGGRVRGEVVEVDRFGNLLTNIPGERARQGASVRVEVEGREIPFLTTYGAVKPGKPLALVSSDGRVEVAVRDGSAAEDLGLGVGARVMVEGVPRGPEVVDP